ncbi:MAG: amidohydrolase family protein, partial [Bacteroidia bacterium]|nr:amidohydrolase family protein [Bacteroidia bacterium]
MDVEFAIHSTRVLLPTGFGDCFVMINNGKIVDVTNNLPENPDIEIIEAGDLVVMPGLIDSHVHINEPGRTEWEGFDTVTKAAAAGGVTTLVDMPLNSSPVTTTVEAFNQKLEVAKDQLHVNCGFYGGIIPENAHDLEPLLNSGILGIKAFLIHSGIDEFPNVRESDLLKGMPAIAEASIPLLAHSELSTSPLLQESIKGTYSSYLSSRPRQGENNAIKLMIRLCEEYNCKTHIVHLSSAEALPMIKEAKEKGLPLTVETCPHYLYFNAEDIPD